MLTSRKHKSQGTLTTIAKFHLKCHLPELNWQNLISNSKSDANPKSLNKALTLNKNPTLTHVAPPANVTFVHWAYTNLQCESS